MEIDTARRRNKQKGQKRKVTIVFDPQARREFLSGFHKRKLQRKKKAHEELQQQLKSERKRLKQEARESYKKLIVSHRPLPEVEHLLEEKYELENHSVSIVELSTSQLADKNNWIGENKVQYEQEEKEQPEIDGERKGDEVPGMVLKTARDVKKVLKKQATKQVQKSKAFQMKSKIEQRKNKKKSMKVKKLKMKVQSHSKRGKHGQKHRNKH